MSDESNRIKDIIQETTNAPEISETDSPAETAVKMLLAGLTDGTFTAQFPLEKDLSSHKSEAFNVIQVIYENENPVKNWFNAAFVRSCCMSNVELAHNRCCDTDVLSNGKGQAKV